MQSYKHALSVTSQLFFCSAPLRLDSFNRCQFGCTYCFASARGGYRGRSSLSVVNVEALANRLARVHTGMIKSAVDELLSVRTPIQLGGMSDPFMPLEGDTGATAEALLALAAYNYPVILSTKSADVASSTNVEILRTSNVEVRLSCASLPSELRSVVDRGCSTFDELMEASLKLSQNGVQVSLRLQPLFPGFEDSAADMVEKAAKHGISHVSFEYLKVPLERKGREHLWKSLGTEYFNIWSNRFSEQDGREVKLPLSYRIKKLLELKQQANDLGLTVGLADNELLPFSDLDSCCNAGANLVGSNPFRSNFLSIVKGKALGDYVSVKEVENLWIPKSSLGVYLNSKSRIQKNSTPYDWKQYLLAAWNGNTNAISPSFFRGIVATGETDEHGFNIYQVSDFEERRALSSHVASRLSSFSTPDAAGDGS